MPSSGPEDSFTELSSGPEAAGARLPQEGLLPQVQGDQQQQQKNKIYCSLDKKYNKISFYY